MISDALSVLRQGFRVLESVGEHVQGWTEALHQRLLLGSGGGPALFGRRGDGVGARAVAGVPHQRLPLQGRTLEQEMVSLLQLLLFVLIQVGCFVFGWVYFRRKLFRNYEVSDVKVQALFSLTFTLSCMFFVLIIFEILDVLDRQLRVFNWTGL